MNQSLSFYKNAALPIVEKAGEMLKPHFGKINAIRQKDDSAANVVTKLDEDVETFIAEKLKKIDPGIGLVGEEFGGESNAECFWLLDPIDGTSHFMRGVPFCTTMLALVMKGQVVFSCVYDFIGKNMYTAVKGKGATRNNIPIQVSNRAMDQAYLFWEINLDKKENLATFLTMRKRAILMKTISCGYEFALIASGKIEGRICIDPFGKDWDYAPGAFLVAEAGGVVANIGSKSYDFHDHNFIATNKIVFKQLSTDIFGIDCRN